MKPVFTVDAEEGCGVVTFGDSSFKIDFDDFNRFTRSGQTFRLHDGDLYPSYMVNYKKVDLIDFVFQTKLVNQTIRFQNNDPRDLRHSNVLSVHVKDKYVREHYDVLEYFHGHHTTNGRDAYVMKNPMWRVRLTTGEERWLMYCEKDAYCLLCDVAVEKIRQYQVEHNHNNPVTFYLGANGYISSNNSLYIHQIITGCYGSGKGTATVSVDHVDRDPLNNTWANLRIATREEQQANRVGDLPNTKRQRMCNAKELPDGITQDMMRKYVVYYKEVYNKEKNLTREFFKVEGHPKLDKPWMTSKSGKVAVTDKLAAANKVVEDLDGGILPLLQREQRNLPPFVSMQKCRGLDNLIYDRRLEDGNRINLRMCLHDGYDLADELPKFEAKLKKKYPELEFHFQLE